MLSSASTSPPCSRAAVCSSRRCHALGQIPAHRVHGDLVRGPVLPAAAVRLPRAGERRAVARALQGDGAQALLGHHDARRGADHRVRPVAVARLVPRRGRLAARQARAGRRCWSPITSGAGGCCAISRADRNRRSHVWFRWFNEIPGADALRARCCWLSSSRSESFFASAPRGLEPLLVAGACLARRPGGNGSARRRRVQRRLASPATAPTCGRASPRGSSGRSPSSAIGNEYGLSTRRRASSTGPRYFPVERSCA